ncbi:hypothetical protein [Aquimarina algicola]|uniref:Uncharacterized protein n=1 Tax=Aquimarina algicola TaxID=2589995 RepID=A0A504J8E1_9FLAO|nr:hypothetical protein [Aquimarina algicola]TPN86844.1 hypothetical protein FHK87_04375 [Aquimarina algicola]
MAIQLCPKCQNNSFTWFVDDEKLNLTVWGCYQCNYEALENESDERNCRKCGKKSETKLKDKEKEYWWCSSCNNIEIIKNG